MSLLLDQFITKYLQSNHAKQVTNKEFLMYQGDICKHSFLVIKGLLRYYSIDEKGKEHVLQFAPEKWFVTDRESVYFGNTSKYFIQALEDSEVIMLNEDILHDFCHENPEFIDFNNMLLHNHVRHLQDRINQLLSFSAEQRYLCFIALYPDVMMRVPQAMVATYLGITPESLSRIRKELTEKNLRK